VPTQANIAHVAAAAHRVLSLRLLLVSLQHLTLAQWAKRSLVRTTCIINYDHFYYNWLFYSAKNFGVKLQPQHLAAVTVVVIVTVRRVYRKMCMLNFSDV